VLSNGDHPQEKRSPRRTIDLQRRNQASLQNSVIFNPKKSHFAENAIDFTGFTITPKGFRPTSQMLSIIANFLTPSDITGIRSCFGLLNQVAYAFLQSEVMAQF